MDIGSVGSMRLRVTPEELQRKADEVSAEITNMENALTRMTEIIQNTVSYWRGNAGDLHRKLYEEDRKVTEEMMRRLKEHPRDLLTMAGIYRETERKVAELSSALPDNIIE